MKKKESSFQMIVKIVVVVALMVGVVGVIANVVGDVNETIDGFGGSSVKTTTATTATTISPSECEEHEYKDGICMKCGTVCVHADKGAAENGNIYCTECGKLYALKAPVISVNGSTITWSAITDAKSYIVNVNDATYKTENLSYKFTSDAAGEFVVSVQAVCGSITSEKSNAYTFTYYAVRYNPNDHGQLVVPSFAVRAGNLYTGRIDPYDGYMLPSEIYVTMGGTVLTSGYIYDVTTGEFTIYDVTGDLYITYDATTGVPGVPVLILNGSVVSWASVSGATDYHIRVLGMDTVTLFDKYYEITATSFDLADCGLTEGYTYHVSVWGDNAYGFGEAAAIEYVYGEAGEDEEPPTELSVPVIAFTTNRLIEWDAIEGASFYTVYCEGSESSGAMRMTYDTYFDVETYAEDLAKFGDGPYTIYIKASGEGYADSAASNKLTYIPSGAEVLKLATPVIRLV